MRNFWAITKLGFKSSIVYRTHFYATIFTVPLTLIIYAFLWKAIFEYSGEQVIRGFTYSSLLSYYVITMIIGLFSWSFADEEVESMIRYGHLSTIIIRPVNLIKWLYSYESGVLILAAIIELIPVILISIFLFDFMAPSLVYFIAFLISLLLGRTIFFMICYSVGLTAFWLKQIKGIRRLRRVVTAFLGGALIPLTFFPKSVQTLFHYLPFEYTKYVPANIYLMNYTVSQTALYLLIQVVWVIALYFMAQLIWKKAYKKFMGVGV